MRWATIFRHAQTMHPRQHSSDGIPAALVAAMHPPRRNDYGGIPRQRHQMIVIVRPYRVSGRLHHGRICGTEREQVAHTQPTVSPGLCKSDAPPHGRIIERLIRRARVETDEHGITITTDPLPPKRISVEAARGKDRLSNHERRRSNNGAPGHRPEAARITVQSSATLCAPTSAQRWPGPELGR
jgi:hypothetical protein